MERTPPPAYDEVDRRRELKGRQMGYEEPSVVVTLSSSFDVDDGSDDGDGSPRRHSIVTSPEAAPASGSDEALTPVAKLPPPPRHPPPPRLAAPARERAPPIALPPPPGRGTETGSYALCGMVGGVVLYDFDAQESWQLTVREGDRVAVVRDEGDGWVTVAAEGCMSSSGGELRHYHENSGAQGQVPASYLNILPHSESGANPEEEEADQGGTSGQQVSDATPPPTSSSRGMPESEVSTFLRPLGLSKYADELGHRSGGTVEGLKRAPRCSDAMLVREVGLSKFEVRKLRVAVDAHVPGL